jgi:hypothetical protein
LDHAVSVDFAAVFRVLVTLFGVTALVCGIGGVVSYLVGGPDFLLGLALVSAILSISFRLPARVAGGPSRDKVSLVASTVIVVVLGSLLVLFLLILWAVSGGID